MGKRFKLEALLNYRNILEREARQELAGRIRTQEALLAEINRQRAELEFLCRDFVQRQATGMSATDMRLFQSNIQLRQQELAAMEENLQQCNREVALARERLLKASQDKKSVEKLKDRHLQEQQRLARQIENRSLDEIALRRQNGGLA
ncbi:flagellar FliJ protein [Geothermobacter ehrlichii]|uniref:Flagellar FliJ protein n=1 Tax=Geothermobacter ehrlichii TaxID=213224 RepID=A0A5D3WRI3_9BACT|nr:flagellar export protein FliJ [Geothermobacter ehrlichii]TYP00209.1 flagellar FliJ protein [Geothermobacter ehrlichii]